MDQTPALSTLTTLRVGGVPERVVQPETTEELVRVAREVWASGDNWLLLGGGSNTVASDDGFDGTVIRIATRGIERIPADGVVRLRVEAGESWDELVAHTVREGWSGIEALSGIPGLVGAAPVQNIGAYGQELSSTLVAVDFLDFATGDVRRMTAAELQLGYRTSVFKQGLAGIVLTVEVDLAEKDDVTGAALSRPVAYAQLADELGVTIGTRVPAVELRRAVLSLRASKGMILDAADPDSVSAGSFFTNPIVSENFARSLPADAPRWPTTPAEPDVVTALAAAGAAGWQTGAGVVGTGPAGGLAHGPYAVKLSAAWLIESAGIHRGFALPGSSAAISSKHTLALTNRGGATAAEIVQLAGYVQSRVQSEFGVILQPEPVLVGLTL
jgi:UDP-N-acetylmuramate dehydrogenase